MPAGKSPGPSIKWPKVYEALKKRGMSKSQAAAISNAMWNKRHKETPDKYSHIDFVPPQGAREAAKRALEVRSNKPASQRGMTAVGIARARDLINAKTLSPETIRRMNNYFTRHEVDKQGSTWSEQGKGWQAWMGWGGDAGKSWAAKVVRQMNATDGKMTTKEAANTGAMIALFLKPDDAKRLALTEQQAPNSELLPSQDLHITLAYLGDTTEMDGEAKMRTVVALLKLATHCHMLQGKVSGIGRFTTIEDGSTNAVYASIDSPALPSFRQMVVNTLEELGVPMASNHGFTPHATLAYIPSNADTPNVTLPALDLVFDKVTLAWADERISFDLRPLIQPVVEASIITDGVSGVEAVSTKAEAGDNDKPAKASGGRGYGARAGEVIRGNLARGQGGQFTSANNASAASASKPPAKRESFQQRLARVQEQQKLAKKKPAKGGKGNKGGKSQAQRDADKKKAEAEKLAKQQAREAEAEKKRTERETKRAEDKAKRDAEREAERQKRDAERAARAAAKPAKAEKPSGGGKGDGDKGNKPSKSSSDKKSANRRKTQDDLEKSGVERDVLDAVLDASDGGDVTPERWQDLANKGLAIKFPGGYRLSGVGRAIARAADRGDTARAAAAYRAVQKKSHKSIALKHLPGGHNQRSHGRSTGRRAAYRSAYSAARSSGATPAEARAAGKAASAQVAPEKKNANNQSGKGEEHKDYSSRNGFVGDDSGYVKGNEKWANSLTESERDAIGFYQFSGFEPINRSLRGQEKANDQKEIDGYVGNLDKALGKSSIPQNVVAYRGMVEPAGLKEGTTFTDKGFVSTSLSSGMANSFAASWGDRGVVVRLKLNQGDKGGYLDLVNPMREREILLPRGQSYRVTKITQGVFDGSPRRIVDVEIVKPQRKQSKKEFDKDGRVISDNKFGWGNADIVIEETPEKPQTKKKESSGEDVSPSVTISSITSTLKQSAPWLTACRHAYRSAYLAARINGFSAEEARRIGKLASGKMRADVELRRRYRKYGYR